MGQIKGISFSKPGQYGISTQDTIAANDTPKLLGSQASNFVIDATGKLCSREDFVQQTAGFSGTIHQIFNHRNNDGTDTLLNNPARII